MTKGGGHCDMPLHKVTPSLMTRIWSALTTVESLCATTMVVRLAHTLAREAWIALSLDVSSAEVAYREDLGKTAPATQVPGGRRMQAAGRGLGNQKEPCLRLRTMCFVDSWSLSRMENNAQQERRECRQGRKEG